MAFFYVVVLRIGGRKGGAMGLQPHLILRVFHRILIFTIEIFLVSHLIWPPSSTTGPVVWLCKTSKSLVTVKLKFMATLAIILAVLVLCGQTTFSIFICGCEKGLVTFVL